MILVNVIVVLGSDSMNAELQRQVAGKMTPLGEPIVIVSLDKSDGVAEPDEQFMRSNREATIKEYFFGDGKRTLSPSTQSVSFDDLAIFKAPDGTMILFCFSVSTSSHRYRPQN